MRGIRAKFACVGCFLAFLTAETVPVMAQDVLARPPGQQGAPPVISPRDKGGAALPQLPAGGTKAEDKKGSAASVLVLPPGSVEKPSAQPAPDAAVVNNLKSEIEGQFVQPTKIIRQPELVSDPVGQTFANDVSVKFDKINYSRADLEFLAAGTGIAPEQLLRNCEQRINLMVVEPDGSGAQLNINGNATTGKTGYNVALEGVNLTLAMACKLTKPPVNKGLVIKSGDYYIFGLAVGQCAPAQPISRRTARVSVTYPGDRALQCVVE